MLGVYLIQSEAAAAVGKPASQFYKIRFDFEQKKFGRHFKYFVPESKMTKKAREAYKNVMVDNEADDAVQVEDILGDVSGTDIKTDLQSAQLDNLRARTSLINEKLAARKSALFSEWSEKFFGVFASSFAKFKNELVNLHLSAEQIDILNEKLELALGSMKDGLAQINSDWMEEDEEEKKNV